MKQIVLLLLIASSILPFSCSHALKHEEVPGWLDSVSKDTPHHINIQGQWCDESLDPDDIKIVPILGWGIFSGGWGRGYIRQDGKNIKGNLGNYNIQGRIGDKTVYMVFLSGGTVYYTARLEMSEDKMLRGNYFNPDDLEQLYGFPMAIKRIK